MFSSLDHYRAISQRSNKADGGYRDGRRLRYSIYWAKTPLNSQTVEPSAFTEGYFIYKHSRQMFTIMVLGRNNGNYFGEF